METYSSIDDLIHALYSMEENEWVYVNINSWNKSPDKTIFYYIPECYLDCLDDNEVYLDAEGHEMPKSVEDKNLRAWMIVNLLIYIVKTAGDDFSHQRFIDEVNYHREFDTFRT